MSKHKSKKHKRQWRERPACQESDGEIIRHDRGNKKRKYGYGKGLRRTIRKQIHTNMSASEYSDEDFDEMGVRKDAGHFGRAALIAFAGVAAVGVVSLFF